MNTEQTIAKIAAKNDAFRRTMTGCIVTRGVLALGPLVNAAFLRVREFTDFSGSNDPYGEHDFGSFELEGTLIFWKIDYLDESLTHWCDPLSNDCERQLTILLAEEY